MSLIRFKKLKIVQIMNNRINNIDNLINFVDNLFELKKMYIAGNDIEFNTKRVMDVLNSIKNQTNIKIEY